MKMGSARSFVGVLASGFLLVCSSAMAAETYKLDVGHSRLGFKIRHLGISTVSGHFKKFEGQGLYDEKTKKLSKIKVKIEAESIDTNEEDRDKHLRSADFFDVDKYPELTFESTDVKTGRKGPTEIKGKLTLHGVTKDVVLKITEWGGAAEDPWGNKRIAFQATGKIDRRQFGLTWNKGLKKAAGVLVGNDVTLVLEIQGMKES